MDNALSRGENGVFNERLSITFGRERGRSDVNSGNFWLRIFWKLPRAHQREREIFVYLTEFSPVKKYLCKRLNNTHTHRKMQTNAMTTTTSTFARRGASSSLYSSSSSSNNKMVSLFFFRSFNSLTFLFGLLYSFMCTRVYTKRGCSCARVGFPRAASARFRK